MPLNYMSPQNGRFYQENGTTVNLADLNVASMGGLGFEFVSDTSAHTPTSGNVFVAVQIVNDTVFSAIAGTGITGNTFTGNTISAGTIIFGRFTSITLTSGKAIAYKGV